MEDEFKPPTIDQWLKLTREHGEALRFLLKEYHPNNRQPGRRKNQDFITAPGAEAACTVIRQHIRAQQASDPVDRFNLALESKDWRTINTLLNEAWFGVPESTTAWGVRGFREAVHLIEEPPDEDTTAY
jgi:hypothetical protein